MYQVCWPFKWKSPWPLVRREQLNLDPDRCNIEWALTRHSNSSSSRVQLKTHLQCNSKIPGICTTDWKFLCKQKVWFDLRTHHTKFYGHAQQTLTSPQNNSFPAVFLHSDFQGTKMAECAVSAHLEKKMCGGVFMPTHFRVKLVPLWRQSAELWSSHILHSKNIFLKRWRNGICRSWQVISKK